jgi:hypothetical protein
LQQFHPNSPALKRSYDRRIIKINPGSSLGKASSELSFNDGEQQFKLDEEEESNHSDSSVNDESHNTRPIHVEHLNSKNNDNEAGEFDDDQLDVFDEDHQALQTHAQEPQSLRQEDEANQHQPEQQAVQQRRKKSRKSTKNLLKMSASVEHETRVDREVINDDNDLEEESFYDHVLLNEENADNENNDDLHELHDE